MRSDVDPTQSNEYPPAPAPDNRARFVQLSDGQFVPENSPEAQNDNQAPTSHAPFSVTGSDTVAHPVVANSAGTTPSQAADEGETTDDENNFTHWVHLADGRVLKTLGIMTHHHDTDNPNDPGVPVIGVYARP